jgi:hypothetical protein
MRLIFFDEPLAIVSGIMPFFKIAAASHSANPVLLGYSPHKCL